MTRRCGNRFDFNEAAMPQCSDLLNDLKRGFFSGYSLLGYRRQINKELEHGSLVSCPANAFL